MRSQAIDVSQFRKNLETPLAQLANADISNVEFATAIHQATKDANAVQKANSSSEDSRTPLVSEDLQDHSQNNLQAKTNKSLPVPSGINNKHVLSKGLAAAHRQLSSEGADSYLKYGKFHQSSTLSIGAVIRAHGAVVSKTAPAQPNVQVEEAGLSSNAYDKGDIPSTDADSGKVSFDSLQARKVGTSIQVEKKERGLIETERSTKSFCFDRKHITQKDVDRESASVDDSWGDIQATSAAMHFIAADLPKNNDIFSIQDIGQRSHVIASENLMTLPKKEVVGKKITSDERITAVKKEVAPSESTDVKTSEEKVTSDQCALVGTDTSSGSHILGPSIATEQAKHSDFGVAVVPLNNISETSGHTAEPKIISATNFPVNGQLQVVESREAPLHEVLSSTPQILEVGVASETHGWLKIRAELTGAGDVNASLTGSSNVSTSRLRGDLPALSSYLQAEKIQVNELNVCAPTHDGVMRVVKPDQAIDNWLGFAGGADDGAPARQSQQHNSQGSDHLYMSNSDDNRSETTFDRESDAAIFDSKIELGSKANRMSARYGMGGSWLNVQA